MNVAHCLLAAFTLWLSCSCRLHLSLPLPAYMYSMLKLSPFCITAEVYIPCPGRLHIYIAAEVCISCSSRHQLHSCGALHSILLLQSHPSSVQRAYLCCMLQPPRKSAFHAQAVTNYIPAEPSIPCSSHFHLLCSVHICASEACIPRQSRRPLHSWGNPHAHAKLWPPKFSLLSAFCLSPLPGASLNPIFPSMLCARSGSSGSQRAQNHALTPRIDGASVILVQDCVSGQTDRPTAPKQIRV